MQNYSTVWQTPNLEKSTTILMAIYNRRPELNFELEQSEPIISEKVSKIEEKQENNNQIPEADIAVYGIENPIESEKNSPEPQNIDNMPLLNIAENNEKNNSVPQEFVSPIREKENILQEINSPTNPFLVAKNEENIDKNENLPEKNPEIKIESEYNEICTRREKLLETLEKLKLELNQKSEKIAENKEIPEKINEGKFS